MLQDILRECPRLWCWLLAVFLGRHIARPRPFDEGRHSCLVLGGEGPKGALLTRLPTKDRNVVCVIEHARSEEHTSELQSLRHLVCRLLLEQKKYRYYNNITCATGSV